jgi:DNA-binding response OmpR family regulator
MAPHVLVIDDSEDVRLILTRRLSKAGYKVTSAGNGIEGLAELRRHTPCCVLLDLMMPEMDGFQFLAALRSERAAWPPVFVVSQLDDADTCERVRRLGAHKLFNKAQALHGSFVTSLASLLGPAPHRMGAAPASIHRSLPATA